MNIRELIAAGTSEGAKKGWDTRGRGRADDQMQHIKDLYREGQGANYPVDPRYKQRYRDEGDKGRTEQKAMNKALAIAGWREATVKDMGNPLYSKFMQDATERNADPGQALEYGLSPHEVVFVNDARPNELITTDRSGTGAGNENWNHFRVYQQGEAANPNMQHTPIYQVKSGSGVHQLAEHLRGGAPPPAMRFSADVNRRKK